MHHDARTSSGPRKTMEFSDKNHGKVAEISLSSSAGKSASEETKVLSRVRFFSCWAGLRSAGFTGADGFCARAS
jgi:hypothetical protein